MSPKLKGVDGMEEQAWGYSKNFWLWVGTQSCIQWTLLKLFLQLILFTSPFVVSCCNQWNINLYSVRVLAFSFWILLDFINPFPHFPYVKTQHLDILDPQLVKQGLPASLNCTCIYLFVGLLSCSPVWEKQRCCPLWNLLHPRLIEGQAVRRGNGPVLQILWGEEYTFSEMWKGAVH